MTIRFPKPNSKGVYSKEEATEYTYEDERIWVKVHVLQASSKCWVAAASFSKKVCGGGGTMGVGSPLTKKHGKYTSFFVALDSSKKVVEQFIGNGLKECGNDKAWHRSWNAIDAWCFNIGRQMDMAI